MRVRVCASAHVLVRPRVYSSVCVQAWARASIRLIACGHGCGCGGCSISACVHTCLLPSICSHVSLRLSLKPLFPPLPIFFLYLAPCRLPSSPFLSPSPRGPYPPRTLGIRLPPSPRVWSSPRPWALTPPMVHGPHPEDHGHTRGPFLSPSPRGPYPPRTLSLSLTPRTIPRGPWVPMPMVLTPRTMGIRLPPSPRVWTTPRGPYPEDHGSSPRPWSTGIRGPLPPRAYTPRTLPPEDHTPAPMALTPRTTGIQQPFASLSSHCLPS